MQTLKDFQSQLSSAGHEISEQWLRILCRRGRMAGAQVIGRVWMVPDDAALPKLLKRGRRPWKNVEGAQT